MVVEWSDCGIGVEGLWGGGSGVLLDESVVLTWCAREIECVLHDSHQEGKMTMMIVKTSGSQVHSPVAKGKGREGP